METAWECECGNIEYDSIPPTECEKCFKIGSFTQLPEELLIEREKESLVLQEQEPKKPTLKKPKLKPSNKRKSRK